MAVMSWGKKNEPPKKTNQEAMSLLEDVWQAFPFVRGQNTLEGGISFLETVFLVEAQAGQS